VVHGSLTTSIMSRAPADLAANLTSAEVGRMHVGVGQTCAHGFQGRVEIAWAFARPRLGAAPRSSALSNPGAAAPTLAKSLLR